MKKANIVYSIENGGIGKVLLAWRGEDKKVTDLILGTDEQELTEALYKKYSNSGETVIAEGDIPCLGRILNYINGEQEKKSDISDIDIEFPPGASEWRCSVWRELMKIPYGETLTYGEVAKQMGQDKNAARAVGNACADNDIAILIPCHRVLGADANEGRDKYRWGKEWKEYLLDLESR